METQTCLVVPEEDMTVKVLGAFQFQSFIQKYVSHVTGRKERQVEVSVRRLGGGYGGKITNPAVPTCAVAYAATQLNRPIKSAMSLTTNMDMLGKRHPFYATYTVGTDANGKITALKLTLYANLGANDEDGAGVIGLAFMNVDGCYRIPNFYADGWICKTNLPPSTSTRGPGWVQASFIIEHILEHIAIYFNKPDIDIKLLNFYQKGDVTPYKQVLKYFDVATMWKTLSANINYPSKYQSKN